MKLKYEFVVMDMGDELSAVPVGDDTFHGILKLNKSGAEILEQLKEETTPEKVHMYLKEKYPDSTDKEIGENLVGFLNYLLKEGVLVGP